MSPKDPHHVDGTMPGGRLHDSESRSIPMTFTNLGLAEPILRALTEERYTEPTPIQAAAIPVVVSGRDLIGIAQTGTGKTAAFALPILNRLAASEGRPAPKSCRVLVLSPTRELSAQILESFRTYGRYLKRSSTLAIGGVPMGKQIRALAGGVDILVATPGRLMDLLKNRAIGLDWVEVLVLDEADRMLDMGFINDIRKIVARLPKERQTLFFSATMPPEIASLASEMLRNPARVAVTPPATTVELIDQRAIHVGRAGKPGLLAQVLSESGVDRALIFTRTKHGADRVVRGLEDAGIAADAIHGNKSQGQRERALAGFRNGKVRTLVATDIAARGIDVDGISHVINYDLPNIPESYVHRIGRTARAGATGIAISFCSPDEVPFLRAIERAIRQQIPATASAGSVAPAAGAPIPTDAERPERQGRRRRRGGGGEGRQGEPRQHRQGHDRQAEGRTGQDRPAQGRPAQGRPARGKQTQKRNGPARHHGGDDIGAIGFLDKPRRSQSASAV
jgi:superfamily II DNA/RNA helicase